MRIERFQFAATVVFALGFALVGSGWSFVLSSIMNDRPKWSVCGQDLCLCIQPVELSGVVDEPDCPLCEVKSGDEPDSNGLRTNQLSRNIPMGSGALYALNTGANGLSVAFFVTTMIGQSSFEIVGWDIGKLPMIVNEVAPWSRGLEIPTPPPRG